MYGGRAREGSLKASHSFVLAVLACCPRGACLPLLGPQSCFGDKLLGFWVVCHQKGTGVLKGSSTVNRSASYSSSIKSLFEVQLCCSCSTSNVIRAVCAEEDVRADAAVVLFFSSSFLVFFSAGCTSDFLVCPRFNPFPLPCVPL